jgi:hypothetical protein
MILKGNQKILEWTHELDELSLDENSKEKFDKLYNKYQKFRIGPDFKEIRVHCTNVRAVYDETLEKPLKKFFAHDKEKLSKAQQVFGHFTVVEGKMEELIQTKIMGGYEETLDTIKDDYANAKKYRDGFTKLVETHLKDIRNISDELRNLRQEIIEKTNIVV